MADSQTFWNSTFWATGFWADDLWAGGVAPVPTVVEPAGGGRRIYDPDDRKRQHQKTRKLNKREREDLDRMLSVNARPRYVTPEPAKPVPSRRARPVVVESPTAVEPPPPVDRVTAAKQFLALDALDDLLADLEREQVANARAVEVQHIKAKQHARFLEAEQQRIANEAIAYELAQVEAQRLAAEEAEAFRLAEIERIQHEADMEMIEILLAVHEDWI